MGKSPGKWIKTLFGKKSSRSHASKGREDPKAVTVKELVANKLGGDSPVFSHPIPINVASNIRAETEKGLSSTLPSEGVISLHTQDVGKHDASCESHGSEKSIKEQAAVKAQAAFRGYLARRAFHALCGIIRLQALVRGHLVRRQAVATLQCIQGIVKLQAMVRGRKARLSDIALEVRKKLSKSNFKDAKQLAVLTSSVPSQISVNKFVAKLVSTTAAKPLQLQHAEGEPNSAWIWLERWTSTQFWKPVPQPKKTIYLKSKERPARYALETESARIKRIARRNISPNSDSGSTVSVSEPEKNKCNLRKVSILPTEPLQEHSQSELEKVKRNLRRITNSAAKSSDQVECETENLKFNARRVSNSQVDVHELGLVDSAEKTKKDFVLPLQASPHVEIVSDPAPEIKYLVETALDLILDAKHEAGTALNLIKVDAAVGGSDDDKHLAELHHPLQECATNELREGISQKTGKRRASFSARSEYLENGLHNAPTLPSYMQATESAKAKLRAQSSPRLSSDGIDTNGFARRHSLPSLTDGKLAQRLLQTTAKVGNRNDRSFSSSRDGTDNPIRAEWRR